MVITRFAPSPTGFLHVGNLRTAIIAWVYAKSKQGQFILRIDDTDVERSEEKFERALLEDLKWMGIDWQDKKSQSARMGRYAEAIEFLIASKRLYKCFETAAELDLKRKVQINRGMPPIYDRHALTLSPEEIAALEERGLKPHYRFKLDHARDIEWVDEIRGPIHFKTTNLSDPILIRENGTLTYSLASVIDDIDFKITNIIRGEDHVSNSAIHIQIFEAFEAKPPQFAHVSLLKTKDKEMSKRLGGFEVKELRAKGILPLSLFSYLSKLGSSDEIAPDVGIENIILNFDIKKFGKATCNYDETELLRINAHYLHTMSFADIMPHLQSISLEIDEQFWLSIRANIKELREVEDWLKICQHKVDPVIEDKEYCQLAASLFPTQVDHSTWDTWVAAIKAQSDRKGRALFMPIRLALTGREDGPELKFMLPLIGRDKIISRLLGNGA